MPTARILFLFALVLCNARLLMGGQLPGDFLDAYTPAVEILRSAYSRLSATGTLRVELPREERWSEQGFVIRADGLNRRLDIRTLNQQRMGLKPGSTLMMMATPWGSLNTRTRPESKFFDDARQTDYNHTLDSINHTSLITYPYAMEFFTTILDMLQSPAVRIQSVKRIRTDGGEVIQVVFWHRATFAGHTDEWHSQIVLVPGDGWVLQSFERIAGPDARRIKQSGRLSYTSSSGLPAVQTVQIQTMINDTIVRRESMEISEFSFSPPDPRYFTSFTF